MLFSGQSPTPDDKNLFNEVVTNGKNGVLLSFGDTSKVQIRSSDMGFIRLLQREPLFKSVEILNNLC
jgi:hypothetical protein